MYNSKLDTSLRRILLATCQFFSLKKSNSKFPVLIGCGVLLEYNNNYYCLSNAHVISNISNPQPFLLFFDGTKLSLGGYIYSTSLWESQNRDDDLFDLTVIKLTKETATMIIQYGHHFLNFNEVTTGFRLQKNDILFIAGFPGNKSRLNRENKIVSEPLIIKTIPLLKGKIMKKYPMDFHLIAQYPRNIMLDSETGGIKVGPKPHGISGSGMWIINENNNSSYYISLIGVSTEYIENKSLIIGTKVDLFIDVIRQKFDPAIINNGVKVELDSKSREP